MLENVAKDSNKMERFLLAERGKWPVVMGMKAGQKTFKRRDAWVGIPLSKLRAYRVSHCRQVGSRHAYLLQLAWRVFSLLAGRRSPTAKCSAFPLPPSCDSRKISVCRLCTPIRKTFMQILLNTDPHIHGSEQMTQHLTTVVKDAVERFGEHITRVEAHLVDEISPIKTSQKEIQCTLEARLVGLEPVVVKDRASNAHQAIQGAAVKLKRAVASVLEKHDPRHARGTGRDEVA